MSKPICIIQAPYATRSGYGDMSRDIIRHILEMNRYDVKLVSMPWGGCPLNALSANNQKDIPLIAATAQMPLALPRQPELFVQISVPNEFQPAGKFNIGITAGIETTACSKEWIEGCNRMDVIFTISEHSKRVLESTVISEMTPQGQLVKEYRITKPIEVLHNCIDLNIFRELQPREIPESVQDELDQIEEDFNFLFVGHWLKGNVGEDRKNVGLLVKLFCETFKNKKENRPGLILKTSGASFSFMDRKHVLEKIAAIRASVGPNCPNVYLLHGELTEEEMNGLYNHPKVKAHVSLTKGEGFGRPLLEATQSGKPVIASGWSGQLDFLNSNDAVLLAGNLEKVDASAVWPGVILADSQWFNVDIDMTAMALTAVHKNYAKFIAGATRLKANNADKFNYAAIAKRTVELFDTYVPKFAVQVPIKLPTLLKPVK